MSIQGLVIGVGDLPIDTSSVVCKNSGMGTYNKLPVTRGDETLWAKCSPEDYEYLSQFKWHLHVGGYACRTLPHREWVKGKGRNRMMHHDVLLRTEQRKERYADHINHNRLDNRRDNLRWESARLNGINKGKHRTQNPGVYYNKARGCWEARVFVFKKPVCRSSVKWTKADAIAARKKLEEEYYGKEV